MNSSAARRNALLQDLLGLKLPADELGSDGTRARMIALARQSPAVFERSFFDPGHFTASAFVLSPDRRELLLILHKKLGLWLQPGGHIEEKDVSWQQAACREVEEETGLTDLTLLRELVDIDIHEIPANSREPQHRHFDLRSLFQSTTIEVHAGDGVAQARWFPLDLLVSSEGGILAEGVGTDESVVRVARRTLLLTSVSG